MRRTRASLTALAAVAAVVLAACGTADTTGGGARPAAERLRAAKRRPATARPTARPGAAP